MWKINLAKNIICRTHGKELKTQTNVNVNSLLIES